MPRHQNSQIILAPTSITMLKGEVCADKEQL